MILAAITPDDDDATFEEKTALVAGALDIYVVRRMVNRRNFGYSTVQYTMFNLMKTVRNKPTDEVRTALSEWLDSERETLDGIYYYFALTQRNRKHVRYVLARITAWLDAELETGVTFADYMDRSARTPSRLKELYQQIAEIIWNPVRLGLD